MIVVTPTDKWLKTTLSECNKSFSVSSPYVGTYLQEVVSNLDGDISVTLLTRTILADFASNASDLGAVQALASRTGGVLSLSSLHAKVYVIDNKHALITSANATFSGMYRNRECGFEITRRKDVESLHNLIETGFGTVPKPQVWTVDDLDELREPVERLRLHCRVSRCCVRKPSKRRREFVFNEDNMIGWSKVFQGGCNLRWKESHESAPTRSR
jgi:hypothetical protein